ncbi:MAG: hypothetical protein NZL87_04185 [Thermomicrobium sp.]|nr:hypothetical protein [Thermomicrobium sp.]MDW7982904.1 hypothetical protein [Thermomicrobium sp.]
MPNRRARWQSDRSVSGAPRKSRGVLIALAVVLLGVLLQVAVVVGSGGAVSPFQLSLALLALAPLAVAVAAIFWFLQRVRGG